jgi:hypothetical protein
MLILCVCVCIYIYIYIYIYTYTHRQNLMIHANGREAFGCLLIMYTYIHTQVMLHANGRGDMWWSTDDLEKMTEAYQELRKTLFPSTP